MNTTQLFTPINTKANTNTHASLTTSDDKVYKFNDSHLNNIFSRSASKETLPGDSERELSEETSSSKSNFTLTKKITSAFSKSLKQAKESKYITSNDLIVEDYEDEKPLSNKTCQRPYKESKDT